MKTIPFYVLYYINRKSNIYETAFSVDLPEEASAKEKATIIKEAVLYEHNSLNVVQKVEYSEIYIKSMTRLD
jgi:hypothetical protein